MVINTNIKKVINNFLFSLIASIVLNFIIPAAELKGVLTIALLTVFFFCTATFFGDEEYNITTNWSPLAKKIKSVVGNTLAAILLAGGFLLVGMLGLILFESF